MLLTPEIVPSLLAALTLIWGLNGPVMKAGIGGFPPLPPPGLWLTVN